METANYFKQLAKVEKDTRLKMKYLALYHFKLGENRTQIAKFIGVNRGSVNTWVSNYLLSGLDALKSKASTGSPINYLQSRKNKFLRMF